jgi:hypothetical protein
LATVRIAARQPGEEPPVRPTAMTIFIVRCDHQSWRLSKKIGSPANRWNCMEKSIIKTVALPIMID